MGIPAYFSYIVKNHPELLRPLNKFQCSVHHLYLDCNSIIFDVIRKIDFSKIASKEEEQHTIIIHQIFDAIDEYIRIIQPTHNVLIAFDGVPPVAKMKQQRERRYKSTYQQKYTESTNKNKNNVKTMTMDTSVVWNTTAITPGTTFMRRLDEMSKTYYNNPAKYHLKNIILSTSDLQGEGEHKIFDFIRSNPHQHQQKQDPINTVIYGLDADLIMLCINHLPICDNIYLFRETPEFIKSIHIELEPNTPYLLDIPDLAKNIAFDMTNGNDKTNGKDTFIHRVYDYIFLCFFLGNDFLPHFPSINIRTGGVDKMLNAYKNTIGNMNEEVLTDGKRIFWKNVRLMVQWLAKNETIFLKNECLMRDRREKYESKTSTPEEKLLHIPTYERSLEKYIAPCQPGWENRYYKTLLYIDRNSERTKKVCIQYLEGLEWTMKYYSTGCPNWRWHYPYNYPPLLCDLIQYIPSVETELVPMVPMNPVSNLVQLCYVLPRESLYLLPEFLSKTLLKEHSEWYVSNCDFVWAFCKYFWESHSILPYIDLNELEQLVSDANTNQISLIERNKSYTNRCKK
jgi:5'-3' exonuclease